MFDWEASSFDGAELPPGDGPHIPAAADCMRCGVCVGACPTFRVHGVEAETPRARVRLIERLLSGGRPPTTEEMEALADCLLCRACESVCPSRMAYGHLYDSALQVAGGAHRLPGENPAVRALLFLVERGRLLRLCFVLLRALERSGLRAALRRSGLLNRLGLDRTEAILPPIASVSAIPDFHAARGPHRGAVALFTGCLAGNLDRETLLAAIGLLSRIGFDVHVPRGQTCCGALHQHRGESAAARRLAERNGRVFNALDVDAVLYCASGCGLMLHEYGEDRRVDEPVTAFETPVMDISEFLDRHWSDQVKPLPFAGKVAVHEPCTQRNGLRNVSHVYTLLGRIPGIDLEPLPDNSVCCGAGGLNMLTRPATALPLRDEKRRSLEASGAPIVVTSNFGCALHLRSGSDPAETDPKIIHPVTLLAHHLP